jgi:hypothetical protein
MENLFGLALLLLLDLNPDPVHPVPWAALLVLLAIVFVLAVAFTATLVFLLLWLKRRKSGSS